MGQILSFSSNCFGKVGLPHPGTKQALLPAFGPESCAQPVTQGPQLSALRSKARCPKQLRRDAQEGAAEMPRPG